MKPGRNQSCPCGSGKKYKYCCANNSRGNAPPASVAPPQMMFQRAFNFHQSGHLEQAASLYREILRIRPGHIETEHLLGVLLGQRGHFEEGIKMIRQVLRRRPDFAQAHCNLGSLLKSQGEFDAAERAFRKALSLQPAYADAHNNLANVLVQGGKVGDALTHYRKALELCPHHADAHLNLGIALVGVGQNECAIESFSQTLKYAPNLAAAHHNMGLALQNLGRKEDALAAYGHAIAINPDAPETHNNMGNLYRALEENGKAIECYRQAITLCPDYVDAICNLARVLEEKADSQDSLALYRKASDLQPDHREARMGAARIYQNWGHFSRAENEFRAVIERYPNHVAAYAGLARCRRISEGDDALIEAMERLRSSSELLSYPERATLLMALGKGYDDIGHFSQAMACFEEGHQLKAIDHPYDKPSHREIIDRLRATFTSQAMIDRGHVNASPLPIIIVGMPRSGTTLVEELLNRHTKVAAGGELDFWRHAADELEASKTPAIDSERLSDLADAYLLLLRNISSHALRVTDKLTTNYLRLGLIHQALPQACIIHCRRDPIDTCLSIYATDFSGQHNYAHDLEDLADYYEHYRTLMAHWRNVIPANRFMDVDYEKLVENPEPVLQNLIAFCGLACGDGEIEHSAPERAIRTASKWQVRQPVYRTSVGRWRQYEPFLGPLMKLRRWQGVE